MNPLKKFKTLFYLSEKQSFFSHLNTFSFKINKGENHLLNSSELFKNSISRVLAFGDWAKPYSLGWYPAALNNVHSNACLYIFDVVYEQPWDYSDEKSFSFKRIKGLFFHKQLNPYRSEKIIKGSKVIRLISPCFSWWNSIVWVMWESPKIFSWGDIQTMIT